MGDTTSEDTIRFAVIALNAGDVEGYLRHFSPSCQRWVAGFDHPLSLTDVGTHLRLLVKAFNPLRLEEELLFGNDAFVCARWRLRGTQVGEFMGIASGGGDINVPTCEIYEISRDEVVTTWTYQDPGQIFTQMATGGTAR